MRALFFITAFLGGEALWAGNLQVRHGGSEVFEVGARYAGTGGSHYLGADGKFALVPKHLSIALPVGLLFSDAGGEDNNELDYNGLAFAPTVFLGKEVLPNQLELVAAPKLYVVIPDGGDSETNLGISAGLRLSSDLRRWAVMPELAYVDVDGESGLLTFGVGLSVNQ